MKYLCALLFAMTGLLSSEQTLVVGTTSGYAPYVSLNEKGHYEGFDIDFAEALSQKLNRKMVIKDLGSMPALMLALEQKKVDVLIWAISITQERVKKMDMVYYQGEKVTQMPVLFWKKIPENITCFKDLLNTTISVESGSFQEGVIQKVNGVILKQVDKVLDGIMEIRYGKSQGVMTDPSIVLKLQQKFPEIQVLNLPLPPEDCALGNGICVHKDNSALTQNINKAVQELIEEGRMRELEKKWGMQ